MSDLYLVITCDVEPDNFDVSIFGKRKEFSWEGMKQLEKLIDMSSPLKDSFSKKPTYTWFLRADEMIKKAYGTYTYVYEKFKSRWERARFRGDEIGWHPHTKEVDRLRESYEEVSLKYDPPRSVRVGEAFHSNRFMLELASLGLSVDSTALPGRVRDDEIRKLNWEGTPELPYYPSKLDYRVPSENRLDILEVPFSMVKTQATYDRVPIKRYLNLSFRHEIIKKALENLIKEKDLIVSVLHPSELLKHEKEHPLLSFDLDTVIGNLEFILKTAAEENKKIKYITLAEVKDLVERGEIRHEE